MATDRIARNAAFSALNVVVSGVALFFLYRFLLGAIGIAQLGVWSIVLATTSVGRISQLGIAASVVRLVSREVAREAPDAVVEVMQTAALAMAGLAGVAIAVLYPLARWALGAVVPADMLGPALSILPWAAASLWLASVCSVVESGLDGFQRMDLRALATMASMILYFALALLLVPGNGLVGLAEAQLAQTAFLAVTTLASLSGRIGPRRLFSAHRLSWARLKEMLGYGVHVQLLTAGVMLIEPLIKALISGLAGVALVGWFEMANRMVMQIRALVTAGGEALVPAIAHVSETNRAAVRSVYEDACRAVLFLVLPVLALTLLATPIVSELWIGHYEPAFVRFSYLLAIGMFASLLAVPAYFANFGLGTLRWNTAGVGLILGLTTLLAFPLAHRLGAEGVVAGYGAAVLVGHAVVVAGYHAAEGMPLRSLFSRDTLGVSIAAAAAATGGLCAYYGLRDRLGLGSLSMLMLLIALIVLAPPVWLHPMRRRFLGWLGSVARS